MKCRECGKFSRMKLSKEHEYLRAKLIEGDFFVATIVFFALMIIGVALFNVILMLFSFPLFIISLMFLFSSFYNTWKLNEKG